MNRKNFIKKSTCAASLFAGAPLIIEGSNSNEAPVRRKYNMEIEIFETKENSQCHQKGEKFEYPKDAGKICPWLLGSMNNFLVSLQNGGNLHWKYEGTPYEKLIDPEGVTTEFVCCPDPTAKLIAKIIRTVI